MDMRPRPEFHLLKSEDDPGGYLFAALLLVSVMIATIAMLLAIQALG
ncbi:hypothetical protein [Sphingomonas oryzagri]